MLKLKHILYVVFPLPQFGVILQALTELDENLPLSCVSWSFYKDILNIKCTSGFVLNRSLWNGFRCFIRLLGIKSSMSLSPLGCSSLWHPLALSQSVHRWTDSFKGKWYFESWSCFLWLCTFWRQTLASRVHLFFLGGIGFVQMLLQWVCIFLSC